ncbi:MAG TPA: S8 family serine peptidase [Jatrophihabitantaceae bacterium]|nr:S8 family serine peptidase [Jatrophihabitantaceae bacterium]
MITIRRLVTAVLALLAVPIAAIATAAPSHAMAAVPTGGCTASSTQSVSSAYGTSYQPTAAQVASTDVVVKIDTSNGADIDSLQTKYQLGVTSAVLASRGIYLVHSADCNGGSSAQQLADELAADPDVVYAEPDSTVELKATGFSEWSHGSPMPASEADYTSQPAVAQLRLHLAHRFSTGRGVTVAVLDTGVDPSQPALASRLTPGWNYVEDDADTDDVADAAGGQAVGHGTFVAGLVALAAPGAQILPERVLDGAGNGNVFVVAQAMLDAVDAGASVINLSFGTDEQLSSPVITDVINLATRAGVLVVAAAGNDADDMPHYPAALPRVLSVAASDTGGRGLATFSDFGSWVDVAAPGQDVVGPVPGGGYAIWSGTSMAAPLVAGEAALLFATPGHPSAARVRITIEACHDPLYGGGTAYGVVDPMSALGAALWW